MNDLVIKEGDLFFLTEPHGDVKAFNEAGHGLYARDTRFLSRMEIQIDGEKPMLQSSNSDKGYIATIRTMKELKDGCAIEMIRERFIYNGILYERVSLTNLFSQAVPFDFSTAFDADFQDMFIVRKYRTGDVGEIVGRDIGPREMSIRYQGRDDIFRETRISWDWQQGTIAGSDGWLHFSVLLGASETKRICFAVEPKINGQASELHDFDRALELLEASYARWYGETTSVLSDVPEFDRLYHQGVQDLRMLMTDIGFGDVPVAGTPWYAVPFGRDSLITSLYMLPLNAGKIKGTLQTLAAYQGRETDAWRDEQPGKIMHELRFGELANTNQSPFGPYYGTVDATPLFLLVIGEYYRWTGDAALVEKLKPNILRALEWIDQNTGDMAGAGFLTYRQEAEKGFPNQGWKDSPDSIVHETGEFAASPIALSEVQGYVYQAKKSLAEVFRQLGDESLADRLAKEALDLQLRFENAFWMEDERFYAVALDQERRQVRSVTSNPGHLLLSGLPGPFRTESVVRRIFSDEMFTGYGIRTMSIDSTGYDPKSYHNGSVWPHDNAMILLGLGKLGMKKEAGQLIAGLLDASTHFDYQRLPELFCGYGANLGGPVPYPTTCSPQAWAAAVPFVFVQVILGIEPNVPERKITLNPMLPDIFGELTVRNLSIGQGQLTLKVFRNREDGNKVWIQVIENTTECELKIRE